MIMTRIVNSLVIMEKWTNRILFDGILAFQTATTRE